MKKNILIACAIIAAATTLASCKNNKNAENNGEAQNGTETVANVEDATAANCNSNIVYFDLPTVIAKYDFANEVTTELNTKLAAVEKDLTNRGKKIEKADQELTNKIQKGLITTAAANEQGKKLQEQYVAFQQYQQQKSQEMAEEQQVAMNKIMDAIQTYVEKFNETAGFDMIICNQAGSPVFVSKAELNITEAIIDGLNKEYVQNKGNKKEE